MLGPDQAARLGTNALMASSTAYFTQQGQVLPASAKQALLVTTARVNCSLSWSSGMWSGTHKAKFTAQHT